MGRVVVIDDSESMCRLIRAVLERDGHEVIAYDEGEPALEHIMAEPPALLICDLNMGRLSGEDVVRRIRMHESTWDLPCIALTGESGEDRRHRALAAGFHEVMVKPVDIFVLSSSVRALLGAADDEAARAGGPHERST